jgi:hypothetical protein
VGEPIGLVDPPLFRVLGAVAFGLGANVCYAAGWLVELLVRGLGRDEGFGVWALRAGMNLSVGVTLLPALLSWVALGVALMRG